MLAKNRRPYKTADGYIAIMPYTTQQWARFLECVGRADLLKEPWVQDPVKRSANVDALYQVIVDSAPARTTAAWLDVLREADIPCGPVNGFDELFAESHLNAVGLFQPVAHPTEGMLTAARSPFRSPGMERQADGPVPKIGRHSREILAGAGYSAEAIADLVARRIIGISGEAD